MRHVGSGLGRETALTFAERGCEGIVLADINLEAAKESAEASKQCATNATYRALSQEADVTDEASVAALLKTAHDAFGRVDYFVNSAGIENRTRRSVTECDTQEFDRLHEVNSKGTMIGVKVASALMKDQEERFAEGRHGRRSLGRGVIVKLVSIAAYIAVPTAIQYASSKAAAMAITKTAAIELAPHGIRVNAICPSWVDTPLVDRLITLGGPQAHEARLQIVPAGRLAKPEEVAGVIHFLCSADASYINGVGLAEDSGASIKMGR